MKFKKFLLKNHFEGVPRVSDFELVEQDLPEPSENEVVFEALFLSVDPYMRIHSAHLPTGSTMLGTQVARVLKSRHHKFKEGDLVCGHFGWSTHSVVNPDLAVGPRGNAFKPYILPDIGDACPSLALGALGMPGNTAWFGLTKLCTPKAGETLVVTAAAGAVGSLVGQIGKILGLKVIGYAGSDEKVKWLKEELKFDDAFNYKTTDVAESLREAAPNGVDCYFDNVGGETSSEIMRHMNMFGRVAVCGYISAYNATEPLRATIVQPPIIRNQLTLSGFMPCRWKEGWFEGIQQMLHFIKDEKLIVKETVVEGFENMPQAFMKLFTGENVGKVIVKV